MRLSPGTRVGEFEVVAAVGRGGMGEVYRARDLTLSRHVALKTLPASLAGDPVRLQRLEREAQLLASLSHPNIAIIHGITGDRLDRCLVLEFVEGETLDERIAHGRLAPEQAARIGRQIAAALESAHAAGVIHRDLKPSNVKITADDHVKVLDFGLARAADVAVGSSATTMATPALSETGMVLGTPGYMSPEQARGGRVDHLTDIWAFGCVLFEMLSGKAAGLAGEPELSALPASTPDPLRRLVRRCLRPAPAQRLQSAGDARIELDDFLAAPSTAERPPADGHRGLAWLTVGALTGVILGWAASSFWRDAPVASTPAKARLVISSIDGEAAIASGGIAISPDARHVAYPATVDGARHLIVRTLATGARTVLADTADAGMPFFSPDGEWMAFFARGKLHKIPTVGGAVIPLCDAANPRGGAWGDDGTIVFAPMFSGGLWAVSADGGTPRQITKPSGGPATASHRWPVMLPGGRTVVYAAGPMIATARSWDGAQIVAQTLDGGSPRTLMQNATYPLYSRSGHLLFVRESTLFSIALDARALRTNGAPATIVNEIARSSNGSATAAVSAEGWIAALTGWKPQVRTFVWVTRDGKVTDIPLPPADYLFPRLSHDGRTLAYTESDHLWTYDLTRDAPPRKLTFEAINFWPVWTRDGRTLAFASNRTGVPNLYTRIADGSAPEERVGTSQNPQTPHNWSPDGSVLAYVDNDPVSDMDLFLLTVSDRTTRPFIKTSARETSAAFSPDGSWVAYQSNASGQMEIYVAPYPAGRPQFQVSTGGGTEPLWSQGGKRLYYRRDDDVLQVDVDTSNRTVTAGRAMVVFRGGWYATGRVTGTLSYGVSPDDQRFLMLQERTPAQPHTLELLVNALSKR